MIKRLLLIFALLSGLAGLDAYGQKADTLTERPRKFRITDPPRRAILLNPSSIYAYAPKDADGKPHHMSQYAGKVILIVNTASRCGYTPQYEGLEKLYKQYKDQGLVVIAFPCNQFYRQEPGTNEEIQAFCRDNYGVTFPVMGKGDVNGTMAIDLYNYLKKQAPQTPNADIRWNFTKFLVAKDGKTVLRYEPGVKPESLANTIEILLKMK